MSDFMPDFVTNLFSDGAAATATDAVSYGADIGAANAATAASDYASLAPDAFSTAASTGSEAASALPNVLDSAWGAYAGGAAAPTNLGGNVTDFSGTGGTGNLALPAGAPPLSALSAGGGAVGTSTAAGAGSAFDPNANLGGDPGAPSSGGGGPFASAPTGDQGGASGGTTTASSGAPTGSGQGPEQAKTGTGINDWLRSNSNWLVPGGLLAGTALKQAVTPTSSAQNAQNANAVAGGAAGQQLISGGIAGTLPAGLQAGINQQVSKQKASVRAKYAQMGLSGSTMENEALAAIDQGAEAQAFQYSQNLISQGTSLLGGSSVAYNSLIQQQIAQDNQLQAAIDAIARAGGNAAGSTGSGG